MKRKYVVLTVLLVLLFLSACVPGGGRNTLDHPAGFLMGIWHGWIAPVSLIIGLFNPEIRVYETLNTGWWYDLGFYISIIAGFGGISLVRKRGRSR